ncbi:DNA ligase LigA-related protein, partial [Arachidicoccus sp.]|uniref:DNA ligase LigA-related protein n=1 Tax=Arachidicoccus sp. TaxID=1872624 RepID=UPI003D1C72C0
MFSPEQTKLYTQQSQQFLKDARPLQPIDAGLFRELLRFHEYRYYVLDNPLVTDTEYDVLYKKLEHFEAEYPELITPDSPTQRVGKSLTNQFATTAHLVPMLSLENSYNAEDLKDWDRKAREAAALDVVEYCVEPKFDGASISLLYEKDLLVRAVTRGDGISGENITTNIKQIRSIPLHAPFSKYGMEQVEIRGEVLMSKKSFKKFNDRQAE